MAQKKQYLSNTIGPMLWSRFLLHRFECDLRALDCQLALPIIDDEGDFVFGVRPCPDNSVSEMFGRTHTLGKNPDGAYFKEPNGSGNKFNLFQRVVARVPESRHWLLDEALPYFSGQPSIDESAKRASHFLLHGSMALLSPGCVHAWEEQDLEGVVATERLSLEGLSAQATPEALTLLLSLLHLAIWHFVPIKRHAEPTNLDLPDVLADACVRCATAIGQLDWVRQSENGRDLADNLETAVRGAIHWLRYHGHRSPSMMQSLRSFPTRIVLVPDTHENQRRMSAMSRCSSVDWCELVPREHLTPQDWAEIKQALQVEAAAVSSGAHGYGGVTPSRSKF